jgi:hypothetical protein
LWFHGIISWELEEKKLELMDTRDDKDLKREMVQFVWDEKGDTKTEIECFEYLQQFCSNFHLNGPWAPQQWSSCKEPHQRIWNAANAAWNYYPRLEVVEESKDWKAWRQELNAKTEEEEANMREWNAQLQMQTGTLLERMTRMEQGDSGENGEGDVEYVLARGGWAMRGYGDELIHIPFGR